MERNKLSISIVDFINLRPLKPRFNTTKLQDASMLIALTRECQLLLEATDQGFGGQRQLIPDLGHSFKGVWGLQPQTPEAHNTPNPRRPATPSLTMSKSSANRNNNHIG